ncbi:hypothetical protein FHR90_001860 [Endobacter medicaginis]|uniref:Uncharacterized protein n=1 Tax=Endobacter medicaginis TaxID=1181271 RepID=A0A850NLJ4_9PROT|nr:hypothetical protein [Endobacter medicaginis]MBB3174028.1 hypothetical protein [Endobacter medicaginis]MCX5475115.1 hypothetical protein [Endobacter medicaginis]NVN30473.1 hypothetical protein [Endobacter medicaginis]
MVKVADPGSSDPIELSTWQHEATVHRILERARARQQREGATADRQSTYMLHDMKQGTRLTRTLHRAPFDQGRGDPEPALHPPEGPRHWLVGQAKTRTFFVMR